MVNKVILVGNLGGDPEVKYLESGSTVATFSLATSESYKDRSGQRVKQTEWHKIELWDGLAKVAAQYLKKGSTVYLEGKIKTDSWQDNDGNTRKAVKIRGIAMTMLGGQNQSQGQPQNNPSFGNTPLVNSGNGNGQSSVPPQNDIGDNLPF